MNRFILTDKYNGEIVQELSSSPILESLRHKPRRTSYDRRKAQRRPGAQVWRDAATAGLLVTLFAGVSLWMYAFH